jgi:uncharacterized OB-fold protein
MSTGFGWIDLCPHTKLAGFVDHLREGKLVASRCSACGATSFPPRADCARCLHDAFEFVPIGPRGVVVSHTTIEAAPAGFEDVAPYALCVVDLEDQGRLLAWLGESISPEEVRIGLPVEVVPRTRQRGEETRVLYTLEHPEPRVAPAVEGRAE